MEGGIALLLLLIIVVVAGGLGIAMYLTGGALWTRKTAAGGDKVESGESTSPSRHERPTSPTIENTEVVGAQEARERNA
jgi:hypothetical protein